MSNLIATSKVTAIVGLGVTGLSVARYLAATQKAFVLLDSREKPAQLDLFKAEFPQCSIYTGSLMTADAQDILLHAEEIVLSPGLPLADPAFAGPLQAGVPVIGDIALFARDCTKPIIAITGSNAKSTVTTLVGEMLKAAGVNVGIGGNLGTAALDLLRASDHDVYVLELSSFQLETTPRLGAQVAAILNLSADHMDRYDSMQSYHAAKQRIYFGAKNVVTNRRDLLTAAPVAQGVTYYTFGLSRADKQGFGLADHAGEQYLFDGFIPFMPVRDVRIPGMHNIENALAALAIVKAFGVPLAPVVDVLKTFAGLPHRCEWVRTINGVDFYNDSKGTNVGATVAAIKGLARDPAKLVLIGGGVGKGADFSPLVPLIKAHVRHAVLIGEDAPKLTTLLDGVVPTQHAATMQQAVICALSAAQAGDAVVLSPACASLDMFRNFEDRGEQFVQAVRGLAC